MNKRRTIIHPAQLTSLPEGTILMDREGLPVWLDETFGWCGANSTRRIDLQLLIEDGAPFVILYQPTAEHHELPNADPTDAEIQAAGEAIYATATGKIPPTCDLGTYWTDLARAALLAAREVARHE